MTPANRVPATMAPVTAPPTVPNWEAQLLDRAPLVLAFAVCVSFFLSQFYLISFYEFSRCSSLAHLFITVTFWHFITLLRQHVIFLSNFNDLL